MVCPRGVPLSVCSRGNQRTRHRHQVNRVFNRKKYISTQNTSSSIRTLLCTEISSMQEHSKCFHSPPPALWVSGFTPAIHWSFPPSRGSSWTLSSTSCTRTLRKVTVLSQCCSLLFGVNYFCLSWADLQRSYCVSECLLLSASWRRRRDIAAAVMQPLIRSRQRLEMCLFSL